MSLFAKKKYYEGRISQHFNGERFFDPHKQYNHKNKSFWSFLKMRLQNPPKCWPKTQIAVNYDIPPSSVYGNAFRVSNIGHVTFLLQTQNFNILTDPVWSDYASPFAKIGPKRITPPGIQFEHLPKIDLIIITHNHYDHLDLETINKLWYQHKPIIISPLGNDKIIQSYNSDIVVKVMDWDDSIEIAENFIVHLDPVQHWSARGLLDRNKALWGAFTLQFPDGNIYFVGDSGYAEGRYFKAAKQKYAKFRLALLPMGAYEPRWFMEYSHMNPAEMLKAHIDLGSPYTIPSHYDVFKLAQEDYGQALQDLAIARELNGCKNIKILNVGQPWFVPKL